MRRRRQCEFCGTRVAPSGPLGGSTGDGEEAIVIPRGNTYLYVCLKPACGQRMRELFRAATQCFVCGQALQGGATVHGGAGEPFCSKACELRSVQLTYLEAQSESAGQPAVLRQPAAHQPAVLCWFCENRRTDADSEIHVNLTRNAFTSGQALQETTGLTVPRCPPCAKAHGQAAMVVCILLLPFAVAAMLPFVPCLLVHDSINSCGLGLLTGLPALIGAAGFVVAGACLGTYHSEKRLRDRGIRPESDRDRYPLLKEYLNGGWQVAGTRVGT